MRGRSTKELKIIVLLGTRALLTTEFGNRHADTTAHTNTMLPNPSHLRLAGVLFSFSSPALLAISKCRAEEVKSGCNAAKSHGLRKWWVNWSTEGKLVIFLSSGQDKALWCENAKFHSGWEETSNQVTQLLQSRHFPAQPHCLTLQRRPSDHLPLLSWIFPYLALWEG